MVAIVTQIKIIYFSLCEKNIELNIFEQGKN